MTARVLIPRGSTVWLAASLFISTASSAVAQSLADIAQRETERRTMVTSGRVFTNANLATVDPSHPPPAAPEPVSTIKQEDSAPAARENGQGAADTAVADTSIKGSQKRDEPYWRTRTKDLRERLAHTHAQIAVLESRLADMDGGPQTPTIAREREVVATTLERLRSDAGYRQQELAQFEGRARIEKVPPDWIR